MAPVRHDSATAHGASLLARRERTVSQLRQALLTAGWGHAAVDEALSALQRAGYLNDLRAGRLMARKAGVGRGRAAVEAKLKAAGIDDSLATAIAGENPTSDETEARALLLRRKVRGGKAARLLASRGFDEALIRRLLPELDVTDP